MEPFDIHSIEPMVLTAQDHDVIDKAIEINKKKGTSQGDGSSVITDWTSISEDGEKHHASPATYCYAGLFRPGITNPKFIVARMMHDGNVGPGDEARHAFISYIINRSPYSPAFVSQERMFPDDIKKGVYGYNVCRCDVPANLIAGGLTAIRMAWEYKGDVADIWHHLTKAGCDEDLAYAFAFQAILMNHKTMVLTARGEGHSSWNGKRFTDKMIENYVNWQMTEYTKSYADQALKHSVVYRPICTAWGRPKSGENYYYGGDISFLHEERERVAKMAMGDEKESANPFVKKKVAAIPVADFCNIWAGVIMEKAGHLLAGRDKKEKINVA